MAGHLAWIVALLWPALPPPAHLVESLRIDSSASQAAFSVRLLWFHRIDGRFERLRGDIITDGREHAWVEAWIDVNSARMSNAHYTRWLLSRDFFDAEHYPRIRFISNPTPLTALRQGGHLHGRLSIRGVTRPVDFTLQPSRCLKAGTDACTLHVDGSIERGDFGMHKRRGLVSNTVKLDITIHLRRPAGANGMPRPVSSAHDEASPHTTTDGADADRRDAADPGLRTDSPAGPPGDAADAPRRTGGGDLRAR